MTINLDIKSSDHLKELHQALLFFHISELKQLILELNLPQGGTKKELILRITYFIKTGQALKIPNIPPISCAEKGRTYPLTPNTFILKGAYKNDLATRKFFKKLIGDHFHFTAFGIDWIKKRWISGNPPTYQEFALYWQEENARRKINKVKPKDEWAFINFTQKFLIENPNTTKTTLLDAWEKERLNNVKKARKILEQFI